ncbi:TIGR03085 family metal-binding protein [Nocardioides zeae]|uniref:TIGR03085 family metal-binding protein n=1 Tax=Nocardioides imazamoxiresistens TaxID=3231893 RepID=A0ABU3PU14_9ACTN|nr:TIGR03085 family metal-binding protein [Nocardioides zeae]MDT9592712.1 TIGR03085 family metal-binding protein [Nocardioides zeae]
MPSSTARAERLALADLAEQVGADAPTLCEGWVVRDLLVHLLVRERNPLAQAGTLLPPLRGLTRRAERRWGRADLPLLADQLRRPVLSWASVPLLDRLANTVEMFVHHENVRRAQEGWSPRDLGDDVEDDLWRSLRPVAAMATRTVGAPVVAVDSRTGAEATVRRGDGPAVVRGRPSEVVLALLGRTQVHDVEITGPDLAVRRLRNATLGF